MLYFKAFTFSHLDYSVLYHWSPYLQSSISSIQIFLCPWRELFRNKVMWYLFPGSKHFKTTNFLVWHIGPSMVSSCMLYPALHCIIHFWRLILKANMTSWNSLNLPFSYFFFCNTAHSGTPSLFCSYASIVGYTYLSFKMQLKNNPFWPL